MEPSFFYNIPNTLLVSIVFLLTVVMLFLGYRLKRYLKMPDEGWGTLESSLYGLLALLLAFTFNMASSRNDSRRKGLIEERSSIGSVYLCLRLYPDSIKKEMSKNFDEYIKNRVAHHKAKNSEEKKKTANTIKASLKNIWDIAGTQLRRREFPEANLQMLPALMRMKNATELRQREYDSHVPDIIILLLFFIAMVCSFYTGMLMPTGNRRKMFGALGFLLCTVMVIYVIIDMDRPDRGIIILDSYEKLIENFSESNNDY